MRCGVPASSVRSSSIVSELRGLIGRGDACTSPTPSTSGLIRLRGFRGSAEGAPLLHHRLDFRGARARRFLVGDAHAPHGSPFEVWVASLKPAAAHEPQIHTWLAVPDERREIATPARRERHSVLDALAHARVRAEDDVAQASHRALCRLRGRLEPALDLSGLPHAWIVVAGAPVSSPRYAVATTSAGRVCMRSKTAGSTCPRRPRPSARRPPAPTTRPAPPLQR